MDNKQLSWMIQYEGLMMSIINLAGTLVVGGLLGYGVVNVVRHIASGYLVYTFPVLPFVGYALLILIAPVVISRLVIRSIQKQTLVERLRETEL